MVDGDLSDDVLPLLSSAYVYGTCTNSAPTFFKSGIFSILLSGWCGYWMDLRLVHVWHSYNL